MYSDHWLRRDSNDPGTFAFSSIIGINSTGDYRLATIKRAIIASEAWKSPVLKLYLLKSNSRNSIYNKSKLQKTQFPM